MAISFSRPDPSSPSAVSAAAFSPSRKGFDQTEVREFLRMVAAELARLQEREKFLERELRTAQTGSPSSAALDDEVITRALGEEAARILQAAREAATQIRVRSEESASRVLREASDEAQRLRQEAEIEVSRRRNDAAADAEAELQMAKQQGREMVNEARAYRERVLADLARRRELARQQIEQLVHGRDRLVQAFDRARIAAEDVIAGMAPMPDQDEFVNLAPTTGPVPLMVPADELPVTTVRVAAEPEHTETVESADEAVPVAVDDVELLDIPLDEEMADETVEAVVSAEAAVEVTDDGKATADASDTVELEDTVEVADEVEASTEVTEPADTEPADTEPAETEPERIAPVVSLFGDAAPAVEAEVPSAPESSAELGATVDSLFARLRAARADTVAHRVAAEEPVAPADEPTTSVPVIETVAAEPAEIAAVAGPVAAEPVAAAESDEADSPFVRRDAVLTPLIVAAARKLKRVLADEQNDILHAAKSPKKKGATASLLAPESEHLERWTSVIHGELTAAAAAGAASVRKASEKERLTLVGKAGVLDPATTWLADAIVRPLRERVETAIADSDGDTGELADSVRSIYREWKNQRIDEHLDDVVRMAFGRGALAAVKPGTPLCWTVDPAGPACADAEDNSLSGAVPAGQPYPTDHVCAPAHAGCRCMLQQAPR
ncbi:MAG: DivIVA domain-containing protein [Ilumatobacteraceae bacterium]